MKLDGIAKHNYGSRVPLVDFHFVNFIKSNAMKLWHPCWKSKIMKAFGNELTGNMVVVQSYALYSEAIPFIQLFLVPIWNVGYMKRNSKYEPTLKQPYLWMRLGLQRW